MAGAAHISLGFPHGWGALPVGITFALNSSTDAIEFIFYAEDAVVISKLGFQLQAITGTSPVYKISLQGVTTSGRADGTIKGGGTPASKTFTPVGAPTWMRVTLDNTYTCVRGELLAIVLEYSSGTIDGSNNITSRYRFANGKGNALQIPYAVTVDSGVGTKQNNGYPAFTYESTTQVYGYAMNSGGAVNVNSGSSPDEYGTKFIYPAGWFDTHTIMGVRFWITPPNTVGATLRIRLYASDGSTVLQTKTIEPVVTSAPTSAGWHEIFWDSATLDTLTAGSAFYITLAPQTATNWTFGEANFNQNADMLCWFPTLTYAVRVTRTNDTPPWVEDNTRFIPIEPIFADITEPSGGGGTTNILIEG
jgi:hypothetical protein